MLYTCLLYTSTSNPKPGDLVFFVGTYDTAGVSHCGIYVGDGMMIHLSLIHISENILVFYQKLPLYNPQFEQCKPYKRSLTNNGDSPNYGKFVRTTGGSEDGLRFPGHVLTFPTCLLSTSITSTRLRPIKRRTPLT